MNKLYADRNGIPIDNAKRDKATWAVDKSLEREWQNRERGAQILDYYRNGRQKGVRIWEGETWNISTNRLQLY